MNEIIYKDLQQKGFTLIEVVLSIVIAGILVAMALRSVKTISETAKVEETKQEMEQLAVAIIGNTELENNGVRTDYGYVGDVGSLPPNLDALYTNPGGYATWKGPYIKRRFSQITNDYKQDAWGINYTYAGGIDITSTGSGSNIVRKLANAASDLVINQVNGVILDIDGTPPGDIYKDSVSLLLSIPNGSGGILTKTNIPDAGGYFSFDSIPIGNHDLEIIYLPGNDSLKRFVSILPNSSLYNEYFLANDVWNDTTVNSGGLTLVVGSPFAHGGQCDHFHFTIANNSGNDIQVTNLQLTWTSPIAYYEKIKWGNNFVFNSNNPRAASGDISTFTTSQTITNSSTVELKVEKFKTTQSGGGSSVAVNDATFTVLFSDGSTFDIVLGACQ